MGWTARTNSSGDRGLPWKIPDGLESVLSASQFYFSLFFNVEERSHVHRCQSYQQPERQI